MTQRLDNPPSIAFTNSATGRIELVITKNDAGLVINDTLEHSLLQLSNDEFEQLLDWMKENRS